jgi:NAD(P)-dependent dehydrogenase (short-subunit alcohol dehydrogenase family)
MAHWASTDIPDQTGRTVLVTGANSGLGLRSAQALSRRGAAVLMACRSAERAEAARAQVAESATGAEPRVVTLDLADLGSIRTAAAEVDGTVERLDVLMNNAGVMALPLGRTADGFEMQLGTNHLGHFALTGLLLPALRRAAAPRVVTTSSGVHRMGRNQWDDDPNFEHKRYGKWAAYGNSKLANLLFMRELGRRAGEAGVDLVSAAAHPGYASTHLQSTSARAGNGVIARATGAVMAIGNGLVAQSDAAGALPQLYAATMDGVSSGDYFGPSGLFELRGGPQAVDMSSAARDDEAARRLWTLSEQLTGVTYTW